jgi:SAM-dependent methyltransferase
MTRFEPQAFLWDCRASRASRARPDHYDRLIAMLPESCDRLLDVGCGAGRLAIRLVDRARSITGLDLSTAMLASAQERTAAADVHNMHWLRGDLYSLPFSADAFDCVVAVSVLHLVDVALAVAELKRVVKLGGRLLLWDWRTSAHGPRVTLHRYGFALRASARALVQYGIGPAWQVATVPWRARIRGYRMPGTRCATQAPIPEICSRLLPGWQHVPAPGTLVVWDKE